MNATNEETLIREVGTKGLNHINDLANWISNNDENARIDRIRYAPSIITRSEAEIFNLSIPRFAFRIYLANTGGGFLNVRRLATLCDQIRPWSERTTPDEPGLRDDDLEESLGDRFLSSPRRILRKSHCIADSLFAVPPWLDGHHTLKTNLGYIYGETEDTIGVPYLRHIQLAGGGLCAQACCFMASLLLKEYVSGVFGIAEITALAHEPTFRELPLHGLYYDGMCRYFEQKQVDLSAIWQRPLTEGQKSEVVVFSQMLRAYIMSGFPVVLPVDSSRIAGWDNRKCRVPRPDILSSNFSGEKAAALLERPRSKHFRSNGPATHAILLIGCSSDETRDCLVFNDPAIYPFMSASATQLANARCYKNAKRKSLGYHLYLPVTPKKVRLPLGNWHKIEEMTPRKLHDLYKYNHPGLHSLIEALHSGSYKPDYPYLDSKLNPGTLRLWDPCLLRNKSDKTVLSPNDPFRAQLLAINTFRRFFLELESWCWVQYSDRCCVGDRRTEAIWIWDATKPAPWIARRSPTLALEYLIGVIVKTEGEWKLIHNNPKQTNIKGGREDHVDKAGREDSSDAKDASKPINLSLLSSFTAHGLKSALEHWPVDKVQCCDLYAFMQDDIDEFFTPNLEMKSLIKKKYWYRTFCTHWYNRLRRWCHRTTFGVRYPIISARLSMAMLSEDHKQIREIAEEIHNSCKSKGIEIVAMATFTPGLSSKTDLAENSLKALKFLIRLAEALKREHKQPLKVIEIVAGSRIDGIWPALHREERYKTYVANVLGEEESIRFFVENIREIAEMAIGSQISLAVELEPGPLFVINSVSALDRLCEHLEGDSKLKAVGLNCDIAHWSLTKLRPTFFTQMPKVMGMEEKADLKRIHGRVIHSHLSGYSVGHFADLGLDPASEVDRRYLASWNDVLTMSRGETGDNEAIYSSLELELAERLEVVRKSLDCCLLLQTMKD